MINSIPYIIERELLSGHRVALPEVGTLWLERVGSVINSEGRMTAPYDNLVISLECPEDNNFITLLAAHLKSGSNVGVYFDSDEFLSSAMELYYDWYDANISTDGTTLSIEGVCSITMWGSETSISLFEAFYGTITPFKEEVEIKPLVSEEQSAPVVNTTAAYPSQKRAEVEEDTPEYVVDYHPKIGRVPRLYAALSMAIFSFAVLYLIYALCFSGDLSFSVTAL